MYPSYAFASGFADGSTFDTGEWNAMVDRVQAHVRDVQRRVFTHFTAIIEFGNVATADGAGERTVYIKAPFAYDVRAARLRVVSDQSDVVTLSSTLTNWRNVTATAPADVTEEATGGSAQAAVRAAASTEYEFTVSAPAAGSHARVVAEIDCTHQSAAPTPADYQAYKIAHGDTITISGPNAFFAAATADLDAAATAAAARRTFEVLPFPRNWTPATGRRLALSGRTGTILSYDFCNVRTGSASNVTADVVLDATTHISAAMAGSNSATQSRSQGNAPVDASAVETASDTGYVTLGAVAATVVERAYLVLYWGHAA